MTERLTRLERIRSEKDFKSLYRNGSRIRGRYFDLVFRPNGLGFSRLAVVVSKKVGPAVTRNRIKRRMRELFRRNKSICTDPTDVVVVTRPGIVGLAKGELEAAYFEAVAAMGRKRMS
jgi:ribonuclease P protein component